VLRRHASRARGFARGEAADLVMGGDDHRFYPALAWPIARKQSAGSIGA
jgi:hypothetical protein